MELRGVGVGRRCAGLGRLACASLNESMRNLARQCRDALLGSHEHKAEQQCQSDAARLLVMIAIRPSPTRVDRLDALRQHDRQRRADQQARAKVGEVAYSPLAQIEGERDVTAEGSAPVSHDHAHHDRAHEHAQTHQNEPEESALLCERRPIARSHHGECTGADSPWTVHWAALSTLGRPRERQRSPTEGDAEFAWLASPRLQKHVLMLARMHTPA